MWYLCLTCSIFLDLKPFYAFYVALKMVSFFLVLCETPELVCPRASIFNFCFSVTLTITENVQLLVCVSTSGTNIRTQNRRQNSI